MGTPNFEKLCPLVAIAAVLCHFPKLLVVLQAFGAGLHKHSGLARLSTKQVISLNELRGSQSPFCLKNIKLACNDFL